MSLGKYNIHRVIHLSLCRIIDMPDTRGIFSIKYICHLIDHFNSFRLLNPQKTVLFVTSSLLEKRKWMSYFYSAINAEVEKRRGFLESLFNICSF